MQFAQNPFSVLVELSKIIAESGDPGETLQRTAEFIAERFATDVCSVYTLEPDGHRVRLAATAGLTPESVGRIRLHSGQGLTGMVLEQKSPVFVSRPWEHPRFTYFRDSGEERLSTFLGVPLVYQKELLGVLVVQTEAEDGLTPDQTELFQAIASQISALVAYTGLLRPVSSGPGTTREQADRQETALRQEEKGLIRGHPVSPGFGWGYAHFLEGGVGFDSVSEHPVEDPDHEVRRFERDAERARRDMERLATETPDLADGDRAILQAQSAILQDRKFRSKVRRTIEEGINAEYALKNAVAEYIRLLHGVSDPYLQARGKDVEDAGRMILSHLLDAEHSLTADTDGETVLIASDISPAELIRLARQGLQALVLLHGGRTTHTVLLAKAFQIPTVIRAESILEAARNEDFLIVDGSSGIIFVNPSAEIVEEYNRLHQEEKRLESHLLPEAGKPAETLDGLRVEVGANIGLLSDLEQLEPYGAELIGLYRSEFPFLARETFPDEQEQLDIYSAIVRGAEGRQVTIRTLDVGGDKILPYLDAPQEANPALGWRSIRISLELESVFRQQIRAILRASRLGGVRMLFPMVTAVWEMRTIRSLLDEEMERLRSSGEAPSGIPDLGIMLEVPAAVKILDKLLPWVDFVSIGTNDLIQYILAADRNNARVEPWSSPFHPAVIRTLEEARTTCNASKTPISVCGEAASNPAFARLLVGMGFTRLSMSPTAIPSIKHTIRQVRAQEAARDLEHVRGLEEPEQVREYLGSRLEKEMDASDASCLH
ncbi:MAG: phosphoenolpyruvate--protein phosphotransferase [Desulfohalobiaceae bacterium]